MLVASVTLFLNEDVKRRRVDWLRNISIKTNGEASLTVTAHRVGRHRQNPSIFACLSLPGPYHARSLQTAHDWHLKVHQHQVVAAAGKFFDRVDSVDGDSDPVSAPRQQTTRHLLIDDVVFDQQHREGSRSRQFLGAFSY